LQTPLVDIAPPFQFRLKRCKVGDRNRALAFVLTRTRKYQIEVLQERPRHAAAAGTWTDEIKVVKKPVWD
jgi:hypothetical protein